MKKVVVGITGASGSIYARRLIEVLVGMGIETHVVATEMGKSVFEYEIGMSLQAFIKECVAQKGVEEKKQSLVVLEDCNNLFAGVASGSHAFDAVIILPCSMGTLAEMAHGFSKNLLTRAADVALKERRPLVIVPRETPLNAIHLENMLTLTKAGASILPAMPGFYHHPETIEDMINFVVGKILDHLQIENQLFKKWK